MYHSAEEWNYWATPKNFTISAIKKGHRTVWLPRQDQLQEMIKSISAFGRLKRFYRFVYFEENRRHEWSMEQLWLAFVMKEKYEKVWDGTEWV